MIKDIHFRKKRGMHRREDRFRRLTSAVCVHADSAASDKGRPFLTVVHCRVPLMQGTERSREREDPRAEEGMLS